MKLNRKELVNIIAKGGMSKKDAKLFLNTMLRIISEEIVSEGIVRIKDFGTFKKVLRKSRNIRLPKGDVIEVSDKNVAKFIPYKSIKNKLGKRTREEGGPKQPKSGVSQKNNSKTATHKAKEENDLITGLSNLTSPQPNIHESKYIGKTIYGEQFHQILEWEYYPNIFIPAKDTKILSAIKSSRQTRGVTEDISKDIIRQAISCIPEIEIQDNMCIPIIGTIQCYYPDLVLSWAGENIYVDIEIDEMYDIESGSPIHFIRSRDEERDVYLVEQGWCVLRISEEDVVKYPQELVQAIKNYLYSISYDSRFNPIQHTRKVRRWTYDEAKKAADEHFREKLLNLPIQPYKKQNETSKANQVEKEVSLFVSEKYRDLEERIIIAKKSKYIIVAVYPNGGEYAFKGNSIKIIKDKSYKLSGYDVIEEKEIKIPFYKIYNIEGRHNIIQRCENKTKAINIARLCCNPVKFNYTNSQGITSDRVVVYLSYWFEIKNDENLSMEEKLHLSSKWLYKNGIDDPICMSQIYYFTGYCQKRKEHRTFRTDRIKDLTIYNIYKPYPKVTYDTADIWDCLEKSKLDVIEYIYKTIPPFISNTPLNIGNKCNYLIMKGELDKAYEKIISISPDFCVKEVKLKWKDVVLGDCEHFIEKDNHTDNFREMISRLKHYWNIT